MHRSAILAGGAAAILNLSAHPAGAVARQPGLPSALIQDADHAIQPVVVMFNLALVRHRMLDTLTELIGSAAPPRSPPASCAVHPEPAPASGGSRLSRDPPAQC